MEMLDLRVVIGVDVDVDEADIKEGKSCQKQANERQPPAATMLSKSEHTHS